jgi:hypothetical protein
LSHTEPNELTHVKQRGKASTLLFLYPLLRELRELRVRNTRSARLTPNRSFLHEAAPFIPPCITR